MTDSHHNYTIGGVPIKFPCKPYPTQISMMSKIITGIDRKQNCLLESPTGSGKSLALLCSSLGWQKCEHQKQLIAREEDVNCTSSVDGMKSPEASKVPCTKCHCHSPMGGASDVIDLTGDKSVSVSPVTTMSEGTTQQAVTNSPLLVDAKPNTSGDEPDSGDIFQTAKIKFRTPGGSGNPSGTKRRMGVVYDDDSPTTPVGINTPGQGRTSTSGGVSASNPCSCTCHSSPPCKEEKCKEEESIQKYRLPKIFFGTRTHKQIAQIIRELKKTAYNDTRMAILGSREHLCVHPEVSRSNNKNDGCKELLDDKNGVSCRYYQNVQRIKTHWQLEGYGLQPAWDVEDLVKLGKKIKACPYFASRNLASDADIVFCPYNYLIDPLIRSSMEINLKGQIIILDEAHNIEDSAREAASVTIMADELQDAIDELDKLINFHWREEHCRVMHTVLANLQRWIVSYSGTLSQNDFTRASRTWNGVEMVAAFANMGVSPATFDTLRLHLSALQEDANPQIPVEQMIAITSASLMLIKSLFVIIDYFFRENMVFMKDYKVVLIKMLSQRKWQGNNNNRWLNPRRSDSGQVTYSLNFWCLNPAVAFSDIGGEARTIVLTSGTLSPMASFASELGVKFSVSLEANHVIQDSQIWVGSVATGPSGKSLNASYKNTETFNFQDDLGRLVLDICRTVPYGVLCFFSSYSLMFKLSERWKTTGLWNEVERTKIVMSEARGGQKKEFDEQLKDFYDTIRDFEDKDITSQSLTGVLFLAVCRGKVSEGMDFADNNARAVITVGIPFPSFKDPQVELKRAYNDYYKQERGLLSGNEWYEIQAYRALNQALGRCLRHRNDWGALILVDERFRRNPNKYISGLSKWVRNRVAHFLHSQDGIESLKNFVIGRQSAAASFSSTQETSPTGSQSNAASQSLIETPSTPQVKLEGYGGHPAFTPATPTGSRLELGFTKPSAVMHGFPAISFSRRSQNPSTSHDGTPPFTSQTPWNTPKRLSTQGTSVNTSYATPESFSVTPSRLPSETQIANSTPQEALPSASKPNQQFKVSTTLAEPPSVGEHGLGSTEPPSMAEHALDSRESQTPSLSKEKPVFLKMEESPSQFAQKSSLSAKPLRQCTFQKKQVSTTLAEPSSVGEHGLGSTEPPSMAEHALDSRESQTPSLSKEKPVFLKMEESPSQFAQKSSLSAKPLRQRTLDSFGCTSPQNMTCVRTPLKFCNKALAQSETLKESALSVTKDIKGDKNLSEPSKEEQKTEETSENKGNLANEILPESKADLLHQERNVNNRTPSPLFGEADDPTDVIDGDCVPSGGDTRDDQREKEELMQKGCDEVTCHNDKIKEEGKVLKEEPDDGAKDTLKVDFVKEQESSKVQVSKEGGLRRSPRKKSKNLMEMNLEKVSSNGETVDSKVIKCSDSTVNVERENDKMDVTSTNVEPESGKKSRLSRKSKRTSIEVRGEGSLRQSPRKRHCNEERRIDNESEEEEVLVRKSTRSRRKIPHDDKKNEKSDLKMEKREDTADGSTHVICLQCSSTLCLYAGFTVVPVSEVPSAFLLHQLTHVSTPKGRKKGNRKYTIQEPLVAFRANLDRSCDVLLQPMASKKNGVRVCTSKEEYIFDTCYEDSLKLNAHWSDEEGCCFQPMVCSECSKKMNGTCPVIGYKITYVMPDNGGANLIPNEVWLSSRYCKAAGPSE